MSEGVFVLDLQGRSVDVNPAAATITGIPETSLRERPLSEILPINPGDLGQLDNEGIGQSEIVFGEEESARHYSLNMTPLKDQHNERIGQLLLLHNVTEQKRAQTRLVEQQRVVATLEERERLARELHDSIGQVLGYVSLQTQIIQEWIVSGETEKARSLLTRLAEVAQGAHADVRESILSLRARSGENWSFFPALRRYLVDVQAHHGIHTDLVLPDGLEDNTFKPTAGVQLLRVIQEAVTNARKYSGAQGVRIVFARVDTTAHITVADDGCGFDPDTLGMGGGDHFGLVFMRERMAQIGGSLRIDSHPGQGTTVHLDIPLDN